MSMNRGNMAKSSIFGCFGVRPSHRPKLKKKDSLMQPVLTKKTSTIEEPPVIFQIEVCSKRWLILLLYVLAASVNTMQWIQYTIIENIVARYYNVSTFAVEWTALVYNVMFLVVLFPTSYLMNRASLRSICLTISIVTCLGAWIKVYAVSQNRFYFVIVGQIVVALCEIAVSAIPPMLVSHWFACQEVATATALGYFGCAFGMIVTLLLTPIFVRNHENLEAIGQDLYNYLLVIAIICTVIAIAIFKVFESYPKLPPSQARALQKHHCQEEVQFVKGLGRLIKNKGFLMLWNAHGICIGYMKTLSTMLNPLYLAHFKDGQEDAGKCGLIFMVVGTLASAIFGKIIDKTKKFKMVFISLYIMCILSEVFFLGSMYLEEKWLVFFSFAVIGFFVVSIYTAGFEVCVEMTYPESEATTIAILNMANQFYGVILVIAINQLMKIYSDLVAHVFLVVSLIVGLIIALLTTYEHRRQNVGLSTCNYVIAG